MSNEETESVKLGSSKGSPSFLSESSSENIEVTVIDRNGENSRKNSNTNPSIENILNNQESSPVGDYKTEEQQSTGSTLTTTTTEEGIVFTSPPIKYEEFQSQARTSTASESYPLAKAEENSTNQETKKDETINVQELQHKLAEYEKLLREKDETIKNQSTRLEYMQSLQAKMQQIEEYMSATDKCLKIASVQFAQHQYAVKLVEETLQLEIVNKDKELKEKDHRIQKLCDDLCKKEKLCQEMLTKKPVNEITNFETNKQTYSSNLINDLEQDIKNIRYDCDQYLNKNLMKVLANENTKDVKQTDSNILKTIIRKSSSTNHDCLSIEFKVSSKACLASNNQNEPQENEKFKTGHRICFCTNQSKDDDDEDVIMVKYNRDAKTDNWEENETQENCIKYLKNCLDNMSKDYEIMCNKLNEKEETIQKLRAHKIILEHHLGIAVNEKAQKNCLNDEQNKFCNRCNKNFDLKR